MWRHGSILSHILWCHTRPFIPQITVRSKPGFFSTFWTGQGGTPEAPPPLSNSKNIKAKAMKLCGYIVRLKWFPLGSASWVDDVTWGGGNYVMISKRRPYWFAILDFWISPETPKTVQINQKLIKKSFKKRLNDTNMLKLRWKTENFPLRIKN